MQKRNLIAMIALAMSAAFAATPMRAEQVAITLDSVTQTALAGDTVHFFGSLQNTTANELFLTALSLNTAPELVGDTSPFSFGATIFLSPSLSLFPLGTTPSFGLFDIFIPLGTLPGTYAVNNDFALFGGLTDSDQDPLGNVAFSVVVLPEATPEPSTWITLGLGLAAVAGIRRRAQRRPVA